MTFARFLRVGRVVLGVGAALFLFWFCSILVRGYHPAPVMGSLDNQLPGALYWFGGFGVLMLCFGFDQSFWEGLVWLSRGLIAITLLCATLYYRSASGTQWIEAAALIVALLVVHHLARRQVVGWVIDEHGERQKVEYTNRGHVFFKPTSWDQRMAREPVLRRQRRITLLWSTPVLMALIWAALQLYHPPDNWIWAMVVGAFALMTFVYWIEPAVTEGLYLGGFQDMKGAKVLDPEPVRPGLADVAAQKAHGDARMAKEDESDHLLNPGP
jgi:hypothetical protein